MLEKARVWKYVILYSKRGLLRAGWRILVLTGYLEFYALLIFFTGIILLIALSGLVLQRSPSAQEAFIGFVLLQGSLAIPAIRGTRWITQHFEQRPLASVGLLLNKYSIKGFALGMALGALVVGVGFLSLYMSGSIQLSWNPVPWNSTLWISLMAGLGWLGVALWEELYFRGYMLQTLMPVVGVYGGVVATTIFFGLVHIVTYGLTPLILVDITLFAFVLALLYLKTKTLWPSIGLHFANNFLSAHVLSIPVETVIKGFPMIKINDQPIYFEVPTLLFQVKMSEGKSLISWETLMVSVVTYAIVALIILKVPWFRPDPEAEKLWEQYIKSASPWARLHDWWKGRFQ